MKKFVSVMLVLALSAVLACTAFAAQSDVDDLKALVNGAAYGTADQKALAVKFLDDYAAVGNADKLTSEVVAELQAVYNAAAATPADQRTAAVINDLAGKATAALKKADITVSFDEAVIASGMSSYKVTVTAPNTHTLKMSDEFTSAVTGTTTAGGGAAAGSNTGVIKRTGVDATAAIAMVVGVFCVLGVAVVGVRKLDLRAE